MEPLELHAHASMTESVAQNIMTRFYWQQAKTGTASLLAQFPWRCPAFLLIDIAGYIIMLFSVHPRQ